MIIRSAVAADAPGLVDLAIRTFRATYIPASAESDVEEHIRTHFSTDRQAAEIADPAMTTLIGSDGAEPLAYVQLRYGVLGDGVRAARPVEVARVYVDAPLHGSGAAHALMRAALDAATSRGCDVAWLGVWERNARAIAFYRKWGFTPVGGQTFVMGSDPQRDHVLARPLP
jgi:ribosomal protein S18 acetylase RimI-like enzyme